MNHALVTGATSFLGYHVVRRLNQQGVRPRTIELPGANPAPLADLQVEPATGTLDDARAVEQACRGIDTVYHMAFRVGVGGGAQQIEDMRRTNVDGTARLLDIAARAGVSRAVVTGSALAVGVNRHPQPLDETADPVEHNLDLPYANIRKQAEHEALSRARPGFAVVSVAPSLTFGPDDPVGAPANKLVKAIINRKLPVRLTAGFGSLDVRDFAAGALLAAERGTPGSRYLISGENITADQLIEQAASIAGVKPPWFEPPLFLLNLVVGAVEGVSALRRKPPPVTRSVLQILHRYAWYDTTRARRDLGWSPRPFRETLEDTIRWLRAQEHRPAERQGVAAL
jgi:dihydroflavonol-4-reductase